MGGRGKKGKKRIMPETVDPFWVIHHSPGRADADHGACVGGRAADQGSPIRTKAYILYIKIFFFTYVGVFVGSGNKYMVRDELYKKNCSRIAGLGLNFCFDPEVFEMSY